MVVRMLAGDWQPLGDAAYFAVRSRDVLTEHHPLLGAWSSGSSRLEESVNNLGPIQLDLLAPFTKTLGPEGLALGIGLLNLAAVVGVWVVTRRLVGPLGVLAAMAATVMLQWSMGSRQLVEGRQQWALVLPFWCLLFLVWALAAGRAWAVPPLVFVSSLIAQTHLTFAIVAAALCVVGLGGYVLVRRWALDSGVAADPVARPFLVGIGVAVVCWAQPLWDQFFVSGNLGRVLRSGDAGGIGYRRGARILVDVVGTPPLWLPGSFARFDPTARLPSELEAWSRLGVVGAVTVGAGVIAAKTAASPAQRVSALLAPVLVLVGWWACATIPTTSFGPARQNYRWLWPLAAFVTFAVASGLAAPARAAITRFRVATAAGLSAVVVLGMLPSAVTTVQRDPDIGRDDRVVGVAGELRSEIADNLPELDIQEPVVIDRTLEQVFSPFSYSIMAELQAAGIDFAVEAGIDAERFRERSISAAEAAALPRLYIVTGSNLERVGVDLLTDVDLVEIAEASGVSDAEDLQRRRLDDDLVAAIGDGRLELDLGAARLYMGDRVAPFVELLEGRQPAELSSVARMAPGMRDLGVLSGDPALLDVLDEWAVLHRSYQLERVAVYVERP